MYRFIIAESIYTVVVTSSSVQSFDYRQVVS